MGKKKYINKKTATTFKIVNQPGKDGHGTSDEICFQKIDKADEEIQHKAEMIEKELNKGKYDPTIKPKSTEFDNPPDALDLVRGRDDLWINQLRKQKALQALKEKQEQFPDIIMKHYDENGFPIDGYDYYQHVAKDEPQGEVVCSFVVPEEEREKVVIDIDFKREELTEEQKEVFDLLMNEEEDENVEAEELEDDIVSKIMQESKQAQQEQPIKVQQEQPIKVQQEQPIKVEQSKKQVRFQQEDENDDEDGDFEDVDEEEDDDEEMEIPMNKEQLKQQEKKASQQKSQQQQQQIKKKESESENSDTDLEIDSDMEREFEREMNAYNEEDLENEDNNQRVDDWELNKVIDDHLKTMGQKQKKKQKMDKMETKEETQQQKEQRLEYLKHTDYNEYLRQKFPNADFSQFHLKKEIPPLTPEEDIALQNYLNKESTDEECPEMEPAEKEYETIITKSLHNTAMSKMNPEQLNIIKYKQKANQLTREELQKLKKQEKEQIHKLKEEKAKIKDEICETLKQVVIKRDETAEEKKQRKELVKQLKQAQKDKKKQFKEQLTTVAKKLQKQKLANIQSNQCEGVSIKKLS